MTLSLPLSLFIVLLNGNVCLMCTSGTNKDIYIYITLFQ